MLDASGRFLRPAIDQREIGLAFDLEYLSFAQIVESGGAGWIRAF
jgi:hypothetical protein